MEQIAANTNETISHMANAAQDDRQKMATLQQLLEQQQETIKLLQQTIATNSNGRTNNPNNRRQRKFLYYCHSHGFLTNPNHTSMTCRRPKENHNRLATAEDRKGGNEKIWISIWRHTRPDGWGKLAKLDVVKLNIVVLIIIHAYLLTLTLVTPTQVVNTQP